PPADAGGYRNRVPSGRPCALALCYINPLKHGLIQSVYPEDWAGRIVEMDETSFFFRAHSHLNIRERPEGTQF
ncbi:MAG: hypothetical protein LBB55_01465, partial [Zoogloeaceae bacterium]|nr:hypothetical protein [Zoogloeaceae bacterium]